MNRMAAAATALLTAVLAFPLATPAAAEPGPSPRGGCTGRVALTFDDGPATPTRRLIGILRDAGVPATFFVVGQRVAAEPRLARSIERSGFLLANHSWAHADMTTQTYAEVRAALTSTDRALRQARTHPTRLMRPPYGALDATAREAIRDAGFVPVLWTVDSRDWEGGTAAQIAARILAALRPGGNVVLQHDGVARSPISVDAVPIVIREARERGYCFTALDESGRPGFPTPRASVSLTGAREGEPALATVTLSKPAGRATSVRLRTVSGSATVGADVAAVAERVVVPAGRLSARVRIGVRRDGSDEPREEFAVRVDRPRGIDLGVRTDRATVTDVDPPPVVRGVDVSVAEPVTGSATARVRFELSRASGKPVRLVLATRPGTAGVADYSGFRVVVDLAPGRAAVAVPLTVLADALDEPAETLTVTVVRARNARIGAGSAATVTIN